MADDDGKTPQDIAIDENLKRVFQPTLEEEVPDRFRDLLAQLKEKEAAGGMSNDNA
ncbi:NepR family anti-sigma factor [Thalassococcus sp. S3]|uniref:NepR family anti-sigma factor n=1 Tax=Thalassococcus sp. S3 TaxID=2017482 RepID=UPI0010245C35|nr:NepR family anti-sigma factor [Thalassococcus sp. S3]QBF29956.1 hypothetical protein CFI11_24380 [Thalassococcus sp. S3]